MTILMGIRDDELVQHLILLDPKSSIVDVVTICRSYEAAKCATSAIRAPPDQLRAVSAYKKGKKNKGHEKNTSTKPSPFSTTFCKCCAKQHGPNACPVTHSTCSSCGRQGHWHVQYSAQPTRLSVAFVAMLGIMINAIKPSRRMGVRVDFQAFNGNKLTRSPIPHTSIHWHTDPSALVPFTYVLPVELAPLSFQQ
ncbi:hypothetical protein Pmani_004240 [Petrolisthes manimaculis]|uniref:Uncharacterized protein n=1 Tax=Petrolisthes manimaculis TaxID=1843537 RepID=A0AAE1UP38_9EUCA|nr:hypothetical protein Pmani_004240 [Petrolisthes manimaculis]